MLTWKNRIESYVHPDEGSSYQTVQAKIAIATGGVMGKGPGNSTQRNFLPNPFSDFIFANYPGGVRTMGRIDPHVPVSHPADAVYTHRYTKSESLWRIAFAVGLWLQPGNPGVHQYGHRGKPFPGNGSGFTIGSVWGYYPPFLPAWPSVLFSV